jgi:serine protease Do
MAYLRCVRSAGRAACLVALGVGALGASAQAQDMSMGQAVLVRSLLPTVVNITARAEIGEAPEAAMASATSPAKTASGVFNIRTSAGSGFIIDPAGEIATNWHVVSGAFEVFVTLSDGQRVRAEVLDAAPLVDLALLKVSAGHKLAAVKWADSAKVQIGDPVLAIGNPLGVGMSVSGGIVSALNRNIMDTPYDDFIQTDAAINHGNSGGPLFNMAGEVIGVNSAIISLTASNAGLGFSMPANDARFIFERLTHKAWGRPGYVGLKLQEVTPEIATGLGMTEPQGSIVAAVNEGGPAALAGLRSGDVVLRFGAQTPSDERELLRDIARTPAGTTVAFGVRRKGDVIDLPVKVDEWPTMWWEGASGGKGTITPHWNIPADLGVAVAPLTDESRATYEVRPEAQSGVVVTAVLPGTDAAQRGLSAGDVIVQVGDDAVATAADLQGAIGRARAGGRGIGLFLVSKRNQSVTPAQLPGPKWLPLRLSAG